MIEMVQRLIPDQWLSVNPLDSIREGRAVGISDGRDQRYAARIGPRVLTAAMMPPFDIMAIVSPQ